MKLSSFQILNGPMEFILLFLIFTSTGFIFGKKAYFMLDPNGSEIYNFGYDTKNQNLTQSEPRLMREEKRLSDGTVVGRYGYTDPFGIFRQVTYTAGPLGFFAYENVNSLASLNLFSKATALQKEALLDFIQNSPLTLVASSHLNSSFYTPEKRINDFFLNNSLTYKEKAKKKDFLAEVPFRETPYTDSSFTKFPYTEAPYTDISYSDLPYTNAPSNNVPLANAPLTNTPIYENFFTKVSLTESTTTPNPLISFSLNEAPLNSTALRSAPLIPFPLRLANLRTSNLRSANLRSANLRSLNINSDILRSGNARPVSLSLFFLNSATSKPAPLNSLLVNSRPLALSQPNFTFPTSFSSPSSFQNVKPFFSTPSSLVSDFTSSGRLPLALLPSISLTSSSLNKKNSNNQIQDLSRKKKKSNSQNKLKDLSRSRVNYEVLNSSRVLDYKNEDRRQHPNLAISSELYNLREFIKIGSQKLNSSKRNTSPNQDKSFQIQNKVLNHLSKPKVMNQSEHQLTSSFSLTNVTFISTNKSLSTLGKKDNKFFYMPSRIKAENDFVKHPFTKLDDTSKRLSLDFQRESFNLRRINQEHKRADKNLKILNPTFQNQTEKRLKFDLGELRKYFGERINVMKMKKIISSLQNQNMDFWNKLKLKNDHQSNSTLKIKEELPIIMRVNLINENKKNSFTFDNNFKSVQFANETVKHVRNSAASFKLDPKNDSSYSNASYLLINHQANNWLGQNMKKKMINSKPLNETSFKDFRLINEHHLRGQNRIRLNLTLASLLSNSTGVRKAGKQETRDSKLLNLNDNILKQNENLIISFPFGLNVTNTINLAKSLPFKFKVTQIKTKICKETSDQSCVFKDAKFRKRVEVMNGTKRLRLVAKKQVDKQAKLNSENKKVKLKKKIVKVWNKKSKLDGFRLKTSFQPSFLPKLPPSDFSTLTSSLPSNSSIVSLTTAPSFFSTNDLIHSSNKLLHNTDHFQVYSNKNKTNAGKRKYTPPIRLFGSRRTKNEKYATPLNKTVRVKLEFNTNNFYAPPIPVI